jgi:hypothetical protein
MSDEHGPCPRCGAPLVRQTDRRKAAGYSLRCSVGGHSRPGRGPGGTRLTERARRSSTRGRRATANRPAGTQEWMTNPRVACCKKDDCFWDAATCPEHR